MNALDTSLGLDAANDVRTPPRSFDVNGACCAGGRAFRVSGGLAGSAAALGVADWLSLAAAPTFAIMAVLTAVGGGGPADVLCAAAPGAWPLSGMVPMYLLMSAFHSAPWLKLVAMRRNGA
jgi:uncharacterized membrane protein YeiH